MISQIFAACPSFRWNHRPFSPLTSRARRDSFRRTGRAARTLLAGGRGAMRDAFAGHSGVEVDTQGDAFFVALTSTTDAVAAAAEARDAARGRPHPVHIGIHAGEPIMSDKGCVGVDVHRAARIAAAAHRGRGQLPVRQDTTAPGQRHQQARRLGEHRLEGPPHRAPSVSISSATAASRPLRTLDATEPAVPLSHWRCMSTG